jgi:hypothetical protein
LLWLLDGSLQLQPFMLGTGFARRIIAPAGNGQPSFVAVPVHWAANVIAAHPVAWDLPFAAVQLLIGVGLLVPRTARFALAGSLAWSLGVWYFGEGLGGLAGGHASLLSGAPGSALLYGVAGAGAWRSCEGCETAPAPWLPVAWALLWISGAIYQALPGQNTGPAVAATLTTGAGWVRHHGTMVVGALVAAEAVIGVGALVRPARSAAAAGGFVVAAAMWVLTQNYGGLFTGQGTDPNTAPILALIALALLAVPRGARGRQVLVARIAVDRSRDQADNLFASRLLRRANGNLTAVPQDDDSPCEVEDLREVVAYEQDRQPPLGEFGD